MSAAPTDAPTLDAAENPLDRAAYLLTEERWRGKVMPQGMGWWLERVAETRQELVCAVGIELPEEPTIDALALFEDYERKRGTSESSQARSALLAALRASALAPASPDEPILSRSGILVTDPPDPADRYVAHGDLVNTLLLLYRSGPHTGFGDDTRWTPAQRVAVVAVMNLLQQLHPADASALADADKGPTCIPFPALAPASEPQPDTDLMPRAVAPEEWVAWAKRLSEPTGEELARLCDRMAGNTADFTSEFRRGAGACAAAIRAALAAPSRLVSPNNEEGA